MYYRLNPDHSVEPLLGDDAVLEWGKCFDKSADRIVAQTTLPNGKWVSTVFLGLDHCYDPDPAKPPLVFETMVFPYVPWWKHWLVRRFPRLRYREGWATYGELDMDRCSTWEQAMASHLEACKTWSRR